MQNFLQVNRALAAEKNLNYFNLNQIKSNPDGGQTCDGNRQSRLMSYRCYLRNLAIIFAVLTMSIANVATAWGTAVTWDFTNRSAATLENGSSYSYMAADGTTEMRYSAGSSDAIVAKDKTDGYLKENGKTGGAIVKDIDGKTDLRKTRLIRLFVSGKGTLRINCNGTNGTYVVKDGSTLGTTLVASLSANKTSSEINVTTSPIWIETTKKGYINSIVWTPSAAPPCTAPSNVKVAETETWGWRYTTGETIKLTATATGGTPSSYTYQWKKKTGPSTWKDLSDGADATDGGVLSGTNSANLEISGCTSGNAGTYKCVVSTGAECSTESNEFWVRVFTLNGNYSGSPFVENPIVWADEFNGTATVTLNANSVYEFKVTDNDTHTFGLARPDIYKDEDNFVIYGNDGNNVALHTGKATGTYTFTVNVYYANDKSNPYCTLTAVRYPKMTIYMSGGKTTWCDANPVFFAHTYGQANNDVKMTAHACESGLFYADVPSYNTKVTFTRQKPGSESIAWNGDNFWNKSKDEIVIGSNNKFTCTGWNNHEGVFSGSTYSPSTYTISFAGNNNTGGNMTNVTAIPCSEDRTLAANGFTKTDNIFEGWKANVNVTINGATVTAGTLIADGATIQNITSDITLTAQWTACSGPNASSSTWTAAGYTYDQNATANEMSLTGVTASNGGDLSYQWYKTTSDVANGEAISGATSNTYRPATDVAHAENWFYFCRVTEAGCSTTYTTPLSGAIVVNEPVDPCSEPAEVTNEIARFFVPCGTSTSSSWSVTDQVATPGHNTFSINTKSAMGGSSSGNWDVDGTTGFIYGKLQSSTWIKLKLISGDFQAGDVVTAYLRSDKSYVQMNSGENKAFGATSASGYHSEYQCSKTLAADNIEGDDGSIIIKRTESILINRIIVTRPPVAATITATKTSPDYVSTDPNNLVLSISTTGASSDWYYRVKNTGTAGYQNPDNTPYNTATWTMTAGLALGANTFVVELYDGSHVKQAESAPITVTAETAYPVTIIAGAGGSVSPSGEIKANESGNHIHPEITATPDAGYHFVNWTLSNANATLANANAATTTITNAIGACTITANFAEDAAPATKDIYYGAITITAGALTKGSTGTSQFFTNIGGTIENNTEISWSSGPSTASQYYNSNNLTDTELSKSGNWSTGSSSNRYIQGFKFKSGSTYTLALGLKVASSITFYGRNGSASKTMTVDGQEWTSSATKDTHAKHEFTKSGGFTGNVSITETGDFYGILVITIQTAAPCTTPLIHELSNQTVCVGADIAAWNATVDNASAISTAGETVAYSWKKKGNDTELTNTATFDLGSPATEAMAGTYVVTVTVSKAGYASSMATKEVTLTVNEATATPTIKASANTVYAGNNVTLTATCASSGVTYQWYTCNDADGTNAQDIDGATNATYTLTAGEAGTYYYKVIVTGDGTHSCGTAEKVYALTVSAASECENYYWFIYADDATKNGVVNNRDNFFSNTSTGNKNTGTYTMKVDGVAMTGTKRLSTGAYKPKFTVPDGATATLYIYGKAASADAGKHLVLKRTSDGAEVEVTSNTETQAYTKENIEAGEWTLSCGEGNWCYSFFAVKVCSSSSCTDATPTITAANTTVCVDNELKITATGYESDPTSIQWQKLNGSTWDNISGATTATYTVAPAAASDAGSYRVVVNKGCARTSNTVTIAVPSAPVFNSFTATRTVMATLALSISDVAASDATSYAWYKSTDDSFDVGADTKVGSTKELLLASASITEAADQTFYLFCVASNSCGSVTSNAITVTVTPFVEEECATKGNEGEHEFDFKNTGCGQDTYGDSKTPVWKTNSRSQYLTYTAPERKYFATAKVTVAHTGGTKCGYAYSTDRGTTWEVAELSGLSTTLTAITIDLPENVNAFRISRNLTAQDGEKGSASGYFYLAEACFTYENACTETTLTPSQNTYEYNISTNADFVEPTFTLKAGETPLGGQTLTYTSSNTAIATVDEEGSVTFEGMTGTVTITAAYAGDATYCASEGSYTITVGCEDGAPKIVAAAGTNLDGCNTSITLEAKMENGNSFTGGTYQWYREGEAIEGATSASYEVVRAGTYIVSRTYTCTTMSSNSAVVTNKNVEPEVERLTPFQYYHVNKTYSNQMKDRHLFAVKSYGMLDGKRYHLTATRNGEALNLSSSTAFFTIPSKDNTVDTVMIDLNKLKDKYNEGDKIVITCAPINSCNEVSPITSSITLYVIGSTPTLALICSGANGDGTRETDKLVVGGDFLTGYNKADLCQQTGNTTFDPKTEWGFYTELKKEYIVTPVNGYAHFNKLNYEPFDILLLTDYPKSSKSEAAQKVIDDMAELCDYRPLLSFKTHFRYVTNKWDINKYTKWAAKGFTTSPVVPEQTALYADIVCYAHPMFSNINNTSYTYHNDADHDQLIYKILDRDGYETKKKIAKGLQGFELADASNFVTIGLIHNDASAAEVEHTGTDFNGDGTVDEQDTHKHVRWTNGGNDRKLVAIAERQANEEARMILFSINCGAQSLQTEGGRQVILQCLKYLYNAENLIEPAECHLTFDNKYGDNKWSNHLNWAPRYAVCPTENDEVRIAAPCTVDVSDASVLSVQILEGGALTINQGAALVVAGPITRFDKETDISSATESEDILIGSDEKGNGTLIFNNANGTTKATVKMYSTAKADMENMSAATSTWQYIGTPHTDVQNAADNYYESWLYQYNTGDQGWEVIPNGGPLVPFRGYCITHPENPHTYTMTGTLVTTMSQSIDIPAVKYVVVANSWTAPIQVANFADADLENITDKTVYLFNTGSDPEGDNDITTPKTAESTSRYAANTYVAMPIHAATYIGCSTIPSMQGFYVVGGETDGQLHLDYDQLVRPQTGQSIVGGPMHAPARITDTDNEPQVAKFLFRGKRYDDRLIILERPDFTRGYDSGWDGEQWGGNAAAPMSYVVAETRYDAVSAIPDFEGTVIGFRAGEDSEYTILFDYDGMEDALYLLDTETKIYTRVLKGNSYTFACPDKAEHSRFILTRKAPQITTGTELTSDGESAKARKLLIEDKMYILLNGMLYDATGKGDK